MWKAQLMFWRAGGRGKDGGWCFVCVYAWHGTHYTFRIIQSLCEIMSEHSFLARL